MKNKIAIKIVIIFILIILFLKIFFLKELSKVLTIDDFLFLKLLSNSALNNSKEENEKEYKFKVNYNNVDFKSINLAATINRETVVYEKIAPGTSGSFRILLETNQNLKYKIQFCSISEKPKNLKFRALKNQEIIGETNTLDELSEKLTGYINENERVNIIIKWNWNFENKKDDVNTDIQDTKDSENIRRYQFNIYALGEKCY